MNKKRMLTLLAKNKKINYPLYLTTLLGADLLCYYPLNETSGTAAINYGSLGTDANGTYNNITLANDSFNTGTKSPTFNGTSSYINLYTASLVANFPKTEGTVFAWSKVSSATIWTDNTARYICMFRADGNNRIMQFKNTNNDLYVYYVAGSTTKNIQVTTTLTTWIFTAVSYSDTGNAADYYVNNSKTTLSDIGSWVGDLAESNVNISSSTTLAGFWSGTIAHVGVVNRPLSQAEITNVYNAGL